MVHLEQVMWPTDPNKVKLNNLTETEMWIFKERLYKGLVKVSSEPAPYIYAHRHSCYYTIFEDNTESKFGVWTNGNPENAWCYIVELKKL